MARLCELSFFDEIFDKIETIFPYHLMVSDEGFDRCNTWCLRNFGDTCDSDSLDDLRKFEWLTYSTLHCEMFVFKTQEQLLLFKISTQ